MPKRVLLFFLSLPVISTWSIGGVPLQKHQEPTKTAASESMLVTASENLAKRKWAADLTSAANSIEPNLAPVLDFCQIVPPGSYGNPNYNCRIYHVCQSDGRFDTMSCPETLRFNDLLAVCDWPRNVNQHCGALFTESLDVSFTAPVYAPEVRTFIPQLRSATIKADVPPRYFLPAELRPRTRSSLQKRRNKSVAADLRIRTKWSSLNPRIRPRELSTENTKYQRPKYRTRQRHRSGSYRRSLLNVRKGFGNKYWRTRNLRRRL